MSKVYVKDNYGFVGFQGMNIRLSAGDEYDTTDEIYLANQDKFTDRAPGEPEPKRRGRRPADG